MENAMDKKQARQRAARRDFLKRSALVGGASGVLAATSAGAVEPETAIQSVTEEDKRQRGYTRSEHVETYYRNARF